MEAIAGAGVTLACVDPSGTAGWTDVAGVVAADMGTADTH